MLIFDLDGTLIDSATDLAVSMNATREHFGLPAIDPALIYSYVGNGAAVLVQRAMGGNVSEERLADASKFFLQFYRAHALEHTKLYPGVREMIKDVSQAGHQLAVLTNKPVQISRDIVASLGLARHFIQIYGGDSFPAKKPDPAGVEALIKQTHSTPADTLLIGDSSVDIKTARNAGVRSCGVLWGFQPESFESDPPDLLIRDPRELPHILKTTVIH